MKPDLVVTSVSGYRWEQLRPFVISLLRTGFQGEKIIFANKVDEFTRECITNRGFTIEQFSVPDDANSWTFTSKYRYIPVLRYLARHKHEYRFVIWVDASDQIFQTDPSVWLESHYIPVPPIVIAARECWKIEDEVHFNAPLVKAAFPNDYEWLKECEVYCGGTLAGDAETMFQVLSKIYTITSEHPEYADQAVLNYVLHKPFNFPVPTRIVAPAMADGWTATCTPFKTGSFHSEWGFWSYNPILTDQHPVFDLGNGLVRTPDDSKPFCLLHQYNRDARWVKLIHEKYWWG